MATQPKKSIKNPTIQRILQDYKKPLIKWFYIIPVIFITGIIISYYCNEWSWFSRSGSLIVICGLLIARWDFTNNINEENLDILNPYFIKHCKRRGDGTLDPQRLEDTKKELRTQLFLYTKSEYRSAELIIIAIGTFIWGFGDLIG